MENIRISNEINEIFNSYKQIKESDTEACGLLIGTHSNDEQLLIIKVVTKPGKKDMRKRFFYKIKSRHHFEILKKSFENSGYKEVYLGTWHTHPEDSPVPSLVDINDWKKQYRKNNHLFEKMIFIIVGRKQTFCWSIGKKEKLILQNIEII